MIKFLARSTQELKKMVIEKLETLDDDIILDEIYRLLQISKSEVELHSFSETQMNILNERDTNIEKGIYLTEEQADKEAEEWLEK